MTVFQRKAPRSRNRLASPSGSRGTSEFVASGSYGHEMDNGGVLPRRRNCSVVGGLALLTRRLRWVAGAMLALYAVLVFPANIKHAIEGIHLPPVPDRWWYHGPRLLMQPVLVWWAWFYAGVIDWPWHKRPARSS
jgi:hypothetical protein